MADFEKNPQDEFQNQDAEYEMEDGVEYEYVDGEEDTEDGYAEDGYAEDGYAEDGVEYEYVDGEEDTEDGYAEDGYAEDGYETDEDLPDGMTVVTEGDAVDGDAEVADMSGDVDMSGDAESTADEDAEDEDSEGEDSEGENADKPKSFFAKLADATPYEVMITLSFIILVIGILLMLFQWMSYDMIVYPKYPS